MAVTPDAINALVDEATTAIDAGDWSTANSKLLQAKAKLAVLPHGAHGVSTVGWDRNAIDDLLDRVQRELNSSVGLQSQTVTYVNPSC